MKTTNILILILLMLFVVSCQQLPAEVPSDSEEVEDVGETSVSEPEDTTKETEVTWGKVTRYNKDLAEFIDKTEDIDNYEFEFAKSVRTNTGYYTPEPRFDVMIVGNKIRKTFVVPQQASDGSFYDNVYMDLDTGKAHTTCKSSTVLCDDSRLVVKEATLSGHLLEITPLELIQNIPAQAEESTREFFDGRSLIVYEYTNDLGRVERLSVDKYYGLPLKWNVYEKDDDRLVAIKKFTFKDVSVGNVKNSEVTVQ